jgi:hypothetical protein
MLNIKNNICNIIDVDPISLEPIATLKCIWLYKYNNKLYGYDAWEWLAYFCESYCLKHPIFQNDFTLYDIYSVYNTCLQNKSNLPEHIALLDKCNSNKLYKKKEYNSNGELIGVNIRAMSPMKIHKVIECKNKYAHTITKKKINCTAKIIYVIYDYNGEPSKPYTLYM